MSSTGLWVLALLRWLMFAGLAAALGGVAARGLARRQAGPAPAPWTVRASLLGLVASGGLVIEELGRDSLSAGLRTCRSAVVAPPIRQLGYQDRTSQR